MEKRQAKKIVKAFREESVLDITVHSYHRYLKAVKFEVKQSRKSVIYYHFMKQLGDAGIKGNMAGSALRSVALTLIEQLEIRKKLLTRMGYTFPF